MKSRHWISNFAVVAFLFLTTLSSIGTSASTDIQKAETTLALAKIAEGLSATCDADISFTVAWDNFPSNAFEYSVSGYCETLSDAVGNHCAGGSAKKAWIGEHVDTLVCAYSNINDAEPSVVLTGKTLTGHIVFESSNLESKFTKLILKEL